MGLLSGLFGRDRTGEKAKKFREFERRFGAGGLDGEKMLAISKAAWLTSRGNAYGQRGRLGEAEEDFREALVICPNYQPAHLSLAIALKEQGRLQEALNALSSMPTTIGGYDAEMATPLYMVLQQYVGIYLKMQDYDLALTYARRTREATQEYRAWLQTKDGQRELATDPGLMQLLNGQDDALSDVLRDLERKM